MCIIRIILYYVLIRRVLFTDIIREVGATSRATSHEKANKLVAIFHNIRLLYRMNKPAYVEPAIGWNTEDDRAGVIKYGVADYEPRKSVAKITAPIRPMIRPALPPPPEPPHKYGPTLLMLSMLM